MPMGGEARGEGGKEKRGGDGRGGGCGVESGGEREWVEKWRGNLKDRYEGKWEGKTRVQTTHTALITFTHLQDCGPPSRGELGSFMAASSGAQLCIYTSYALAYYVLAG